MPTEVGRYAQPDDLAVVEGEPADGDPFRVYLTPLPYGPLVVLEGNSAAIWQEAQDDESGGLVERLAAESGLRAEEIRDDVEKFLDQLVEAGLLRRDPAD
jgi:hypothetical protein